ncbi:AAA family ATPase [Vibrio phage vB_ValP_VA-RY-3]|nr:AAA family ATPase [Vibrio phage vB_ValP_VA-RY-3]
MAIKIQNTKDIVFDAVKCVVYGGAGVGKTRLCATAPKPIIISAEEGLLSLSDVDCDFIEIKTLNDLDSAYRDLKKLEPGKYESICLDSLSEIAEALLQEILPDFKDPRQAYAKLAQSMIPMLKKFRDLKGYNTVFTVKEDDIFDEDGTFIKHDLLMPGKQLNKHIPYLVDELFHMQVDRKGITYLQTKPSRKSFAKDRSGALDPKGEFAKDADSVPNLAELFEKIRAKKAA